MLHDEKCQRRPCSPARPGSACKAHNSIMRLGELVRRVRRCRASLPGWLHAHDTYTYGYQVLVLLVLRHRFKSSRLVSVKHAVHMPHMR